MTTPSSARKRALRWMIREDRQMTWAADLETIRQQSKVLTHHRTILAYTRDATRAAIAEMRAAKGPLSEVLHQRADECEQALDAILEFHE